MKSLPLWWVLLCFRFGVALCNLSQPCHRAFFSLSTLCGSPSFPPQTFWSEVAFFFVCFFPSTPNTQTHRTWELLISFYFLFFIFFLQPLIPKLIEPRAFFFFFFLFFNPQYPNSPNPNCSQAPFIVFLFIHSLNPDCSHRLLPP